MLNRYLRRELEAQRNYNDTLNTRIEGLEVEVAEWKAQAQAAEMSLTFVLGVLMDTEKTLRTAEQKKTRKGPRRADA